MRCVAVIHRNVRATHVFVVYEGTAVDARKTGTPRQSSASARLCVQFLDSRIHPFALLLCSDLSDPFPQRTFPLSLWFSVRPLVFCAYPRQLWTWTSKSCFRTDCLPTSLSMSSFVRLPPLLPLLLLLLLVLLRLLQTLDIRLATSMSQVP